MLFAKTVFSGRGGNKLNLAEEDAASVRWREIILKLSDNLREAADARSDLSPVFMEALHSALENLLLLGEEADLIALEEWLDQDRESRRSATHTVESETVESETVEPSITPSSERDAQLTPRGAQRRQAQRRIACAPDDSSTESSAHPTSLDSRREDLRRAEHDRRSQRERRAS